MSSYKSHDALRTRLKKDSLSRPLMVLRALRLTLDGHALATPPPPLELEIFQARLLCSPHPPGELAVSASAQELPRNSCVH